MLELKNISSGYKKKPVLTEINETFKENELTAIIGPNGSGKSTLLKTIITTAEKFNGEIIIDDKNSKSYTKSELARKIAYLPQGKNAADMTVFQTVIHGRFPHLKYPRKYSEKDKEIALKAINEMGLNGYENYSLAALSGGMRQKAYIAMALAQNSKYIFLDEPTAFLDIANRFTLMDNLKKLTSVGKSVVVVLHELTLAFEYADKITVMHNGKITLSGSPTEIYKNELINDIFSVKIEKCETRYYYKKN